ncbi:MAG: hypothetical protein KBD53_12455 [Candidatus Omnitrophica bacterium]|nr:hypothetical protein [Candidatus Omnitrophota bacterium]
MLPLSKKTEKLIEKLFDSDEERQRISKILINKCGNNVPFCEKSTPEEIERIRFAVLKVTSEEGKFEEWVKLACLDWRDIFIAAGFANDIKVHQWWADRVLKGK